LTQLDFLYELVKIHYFVGLRVEVSPLNDPIPHKMGHN
jgi:hypothetical protein